MYELQVEGMTCNHCISAVTNAVIEIDAAAKVGVDLPARKVRVESSADIDAVKSAIAEAGYEVASSKNI